MSRDPGADARWRFDRSVGRLSAVDDIVADYATSYCGLPYRRRDLFDSRIDEAPTRVVWSIADEPVVEYLHDEKGASRLVVHEINLLGPLRKQLRSRHLKISFSHALD